MYGPNLKYIVKWRRRDTRESWNNRTVKGDVSQYTVAPTPIYTPYEIKVQALNDYGIAMEPDTVIGYSGEDCEYSHSPRKLEIEKADCIYFLLVGDNWQPFNTRSVMTNILPKWVFKCSNRHYFAQNEMKMFKIS